MWPFRRSEPKPASALDLAQVAAIPLIPLFEKREPFASWRPPDQAIPPEQEVLIQVGVCGYQLFVFLKLIERRFGADIARAVGEEQKAAVNRLPDSMGDQLLELLGIIDSGFRTAATGPQTVPGHPDIEVPVEYPIALSLLTHNIGSPYFQQPDLLLAARDKLDFTLLLVGLWNKASQALRRAGEILVIGYRLHPADSAAHYLFATSLAGNMRRPHVQVVSPGGPSGDNWDDLCALADLPNPVRIRKPFEEWVLAPE